MELSYKYNKSRLIYAVYNRNGKYIKFYDTINILPYSIKEIGKYLKLKKYNMKRKRLVDYCKRDVEILYKFVSEMRTMFNEVFNIEMGYTLSMNAMRIYKKYKNLDFKLKRYVESIRKSYYGGRVEIFYYGKYKGMIYENDINSMYPYCMKTLTFPDWNSLQKSKKCNIAYEGVSYCKVKSNLEVPLLPIRTGDGLKYVNGTFSGVWTNIELRNFEFHGGKIIKNYWTIYSKRKIRDLFNEYVNKLYEFKKNEENEYRRLLFKLLLNSLYGKFGFDGKGEEIVPYSPGKNKFCQIIFGKEKIYTLRDTTVSTGYQNVLIASYITAQARILLSNLLTKNFDHLLYCDTDSLFTTKSIVDKNKILGKLSFKRKHKDGIFIQPKLYMVGEQVKAKGLKLKTGKQFNDYIKKGYTKVIRPVKIKTALRDGKKVNVWTKQKKEMRSMYSKREVLKNGKTKAWIKI
jgi:hypothetical protein